jgi:hypothetical protein
LDGRIIFSNINFTFVLIPSPLYPNKSALATDKKISSKIVSICLRKYLNLMMTSKPLKNLAKILSVKVIGVRAKEICRFLVLWTEDFQLLSGTELAPSVSQ